MKRLILLALMLIPGVVLACGANEEQVFACTTTKAKFVQVCQAPTAVNYAFGKKGQKPELALTSSNEKMRWVRDGGTGGDTDALTFTNGRTRYLISVYTYFDKLSTAENEGGLSASLEVLQGDKTLANIECQESGLKFNPDALKAKSIRWGEDGTDSF